MGCETAIDGYIVELISKEDLILKEMQRTSEVRPPQITKLSHLSKLLHGLDLLKEHIESKKTEFIQSCRVGANSEDEECKAMYNKLKVYITDNRHQINSEVMDMAIDGVDIVEGTFFAIEQTLKESQVDRYIRDCKIIQKIER